VVLHQIMLKPDRGASVLNLVICCHELSYLWYTIIRCNGGGGVVWFRKLTSISVQVPLIFYNHVMQNDTCRHYIIYVCHAPQSSRVHRYPKPCSQNTKCALYILSNRFLSFCIYAFFSICWLAPCLHKCAPVRVNFIV
jgi:hypothetical protein